MLGGLRRINPERIKAIRRRGRNRHRIRIDTATIDSRLSNEETGKGQAINVQDKN